MKALAHFKTLQPRFYNPHNVSVSTTYRKGSQSSKSSFRTICFSSRLNNKFTTNNALKNTTFRQNYSTSTPVQTQESNEVGTDHQSIGKHQELFMHHPLSPGNAFFLPHGTRIYLKLQSFLRNEYLKRGYEEVITPQLFNKELWQISGHWDNYKNDMFNVTGASHNKSTEPDQHEHEYMLKPMNCPSHCLMYAHRTRSYRELPIRFADFGMLHRNEHTGSLTGLTRLRKFQQDDAHIFCSEDQIKSEMNGCLDFMSYVYSTFGFNFSLELSTRPDKHLGDPKMWERAEQQLTEVLNDFGKPWKVNPGDGAFYGPKIDVHIKDALGRPHQCATIQLDFQLPKRFNLEFTTEENGVIKQPVMIHRAIFGSIERMLAVLMEHYGGKWPLWISPRQCMVVPISEKSYDYANEVAQEIKKAGYFVDVDTTDKKKFQKKIREAQLLQYNYILVVGAEETQNKTVNVRTREMAIQGAIPLPQFLAQMKEQVDKFQ